MPATNSTTNYRTSILTLVFFLVLHSASSQVFDYEQVPKTLSFGPRFGITTSTVTGDGLGNKKFQVAYVIGGFARYQLSEKWALEGQFNYAHRGANFTPSTSFVLEKGPLEDIDLRYIDVPLIANYNFTYRLFGKAFNTDVFAGAQVSFLSNAKSGTIDIRENLNQTDVGLVFGSGFNLGRVLLYGSTKLGLRDINKNLQIQDEVFNTRTPRFKSISSEWTVAYRLSK